jgi:hypothetical protein
MFVQHCCNASEVSSRRGAAVAARNRALSEWDKANPDMDHDQALFRREILPRLGIVPCGVAEPRNVLIRMDPRVHEASARWTADEVRSTTVQIELLLRESLLQAGRLPSPESRGEIMTVRWELSWPLWGETHGR